MRTAEAVRRYRNASQRHRVVTNGGGHTQATTYALERHAATRAAMLAILMDGGEHDLVGLLVEEDKLAERLVGITEPRPELSARLDGVRRILRSVGK